MISVLPLVIIAGPPGVRERLEDPRGVLPRGAAPNQGEALVFVDLERSATICVFCLPQGEPLV